MTQLPDLERAYQRYALVERGLKARTLRDIVRLLSQLCQFTGSNRLQDLTTSAIRAFLYHGREQKRWSAKTFRLYRQYLKSFFSWCVSRQYLDRNPVAEIERPKLPSRLPRCLSHKNALLVLAHAAHVSWFTEWERFRNEAIIATFLMTGIRLQELQNLQRTDVDLEAEELLVRSGKGWKDRLIPIHARLKRILGGYFRESRRQQKQSNWVFHGLRTRGPLQQKAIRTVCSRIGRSSGITFTPHVLRHTFAREMLDQGMEIFQLKELLGHASVATTQVYASVSRATLKRALGQVRMY